MIGPKARVYEVIRRYPETTDYFLELGLCGCSIGESPGRRGVELTLEELAKERGIELEKLLKELLSRVR